MGKYKFSPGNPDKREETMGETAVRFYIASAGDASCEPPVFPCRRVLSMETEPRTLNEGELHSARKAAVEIIQKKKPEEARTIFTQGLRPVRSVREMESLLQSQGQLKPQGVHLQASPFCECEYLRRRRWTSEIDGPSSAPF